MIPKSLAEVAQFAVAGESFDLCLANFLDGFYYAPKAAGLLAAPVLLEPIAGELGRVQDAYLAATAEELSRRFEFPSPAWIQDDSRKLHRPWFASSLASLRAVLIQESPPGFRARNLFVSENALWRV